MKATIKEISDASWKFFHTPTTKCRPCNIFAALNGNHLLMANVFKLQFVKKFGLLLMGFRKCSFSDFFFFFFFFIFANFKWWFSKIIRFHNGFSVFLWSFVTSQIFFDLHTFDNETIAILIFFFFFWILHGYVFCFFIFSKLKKHYDLTFDDIIKKYCCALCYYKFKLHK